MEETTPAPEQEALVSAPCAHFSANVVELYDFINIMTMQRKQLNAMGRKFVQTFSVVPAELRREFISDEVFNPAMEIMKKGPGIADVAANFFPILLELVFCRAVDYYLFYLAELLALIFRARPEALRSDEKVSVASILEHSTMEDLVDSITERKVLELTFKSIAVLSEDLDKKMGFKLFENDDELRNAVRLVENRNLFIHNRGVVNRLYLSRLPGCGLKLGDKLETSTESHTADVAFLINIVGQTDHRASMKFGIPATEPMPESKFKAAIATAEKL
jgi:hypothetical protein